MSVRVVLCVIAFACAAASTVPLLAASAQVQGMCCGGPSDCIDGGKCCDAQSLGKDACAPDAPGWCMAACIPND
jgi:hypothetical protein